MNVNSISAGLADSVYSPYTASSAATAETEEKAAFATAKQTDPGEAAIYTPKDSHKGANALDSETIKAMKDELEQRTQNLIKQMLGQQLDAYSIADDSFWQKFRTGDFQATPEQIAQAKKDVAEDGYWGVEQTSDRIVKYATALSGGDPEKLDTMISAFEKGFQEATKSWGGTLPDISQRTREAVLDKFDKLKQDYAGGTV